MAVPRVIRCDTTARSTWSLPFPAACILFSRHMYPFSRQERGPQLPAAPLAAAVLRKSHSPSLAAGETGSKQEEMAVFLLSFSS